jgi:hypothetical protein
MGQDRERDESRNTEDPIKFPFACLVDRYLAELRITVASISPRASSTAAPS